MADDDPAIAALKGMPTDEDVGGAVPTGGEDPAITALKNMPTDDDVDAPPAAPPPPPRTLGPPRLHGQTRMPRPPPTPTQGAPAGARGPAPPPPPEDLSFGSVVGGMLNNLGPSIGGQIQAAISPLLHPVTTAKSLYSLGKAGAAGVGLIDQGDEAQRAKDFAPMRALGHMYAQRYDPSRWGAPGGLLSTLKNDPAALGTDLAIPLSMGAGSELALTKLGLPEELAAAVAKGSGVAEAAVNPVGYIPRAVGLAAKGPAAAIRAVRGAGAKGSAVAKTLQSIDETTPIARQIVDGVAPSTEHAVEVGQNIAGWRPKVAKAMTDLTGDVDQDGPHPTAAGQELENQQIATHNAAIDNYDNMRAMPGEFDPSFAQGLHGAVADAFAKSGLPPTTGPGSIGALTGTYGKTAQAMNAMHDQIADLASHDALSANNLMNVRQEIGSYFKGASGSDIKGLRTLQEALDNHIAGSAEAGDFAGGDGAAVAAGMRKAIDGYRNYQNTFHEGPVGEIVDTLRSGQTADASGRLSPSSPGVTEAATSQLGKALINKNLTTPGGASQLYHQVSGIMGGAGTPGQDALDNYVRHTVSKTDSAGNLVAKPEQIKGFLNSNSAMRRSVFPDTDPKTTRMHELADAHAALNAPTLRGSREAGMAKTITRHIGALGLRGGAAWLGEQLPLPRPLGAILGYGAEQGTEAALKAARRARAFIPATRAARKGTSFTTKVARRGAVNAALYGATPQTPQEQQQEAEKNDQDIVTAAPPVADVAKAADMGKAPPATPTDVDTAVRMAIAEGDQTPEGWKAVAAVMRNRSLESGHTLTHLAAEPRAFEAYGNKHYTAPQPGSAQYQRVLAAIAPVLAGKEDPTGGADSYYSPSQQKRLAETRHDRNEKASFDDGTGQMIGTQLFFKNKYRRAHAAGGRVIDMTEQLMKRAEHAQKAAQASTKPMLGLSDDTVARALRVAQRGL